jgi:UDP-N-acetylmuramate dehydrogenase
MQIQENFSLKPYNTFGIDVKAKWFASFQSGEELNEALTFGSKNSVSPLILGGGSNILFTKDYNGLVLKNEINGIELIHEDEEYIYVKVGAGENWHRFVMHCVDRNWAGLENLSLIPGNAGAAPMQNIGAYGVELRDVFHDLEAFHIHDKKIVMFTLSDCEFGYRDSIFKRKYKNQFVILTITFRLRKHPIFHTSYGAIQQELEKMQVTYLNMRKISQAVINIRSSKLPDPAVIGNAGSFFKNPVVPIEKLHELQKKYSVIPNYPIDDSHSTTHDSRFIKLAAAWLIEQCGWKGYRRGDAGSYEKQPLVLVNYGNASGKEIFELSEEILQSVKNKFGVDLEREVNII